MKTADPSMSLMLPIRPVYWEMIAAGTKRVELRRVVPNVAPGTIIVFYASAPVSAIVGICDLMDVTIAPPGTLWSTVGPLSGLDRQTFREYYDGKHRGVALHLSRVKPFSRPHRLADIQLYWEDFTAPQSFRYVSPERLDWLLAEAVRGSSTTEAARFFEIAAHVASAVGRRLSSLSRLALPARRPD